MNASSSSDTAARLSVQIPATLDAWERATATVLVDNRAAQPLLPVLVRLATARGALEEWGIEGTTLRWARKVRGRKTAAGWEALLGPEMESARIAGPPSDLHRAADRELVRVEPLAPGASVELHAYFDAAYDHGDRLDALLVYIVLDPRERPICVVTEKPSRLGFVACKPAADLTGGDLYLPADELARDRRTLLASVPLSPRRPAFDIDAARGRAGIPDGPFGYDTQARRWVLVDARSRRTLLVGATGPMDEMPGDWLDVFTALNAAPETSVTWTVRSAEEAETLRAGLERAGIECRPRRHKGAAGSTALVVRVDRSNVEALAHRIRETGARLEGAHIRGEQ
jgi:hypothetical protein